MYGKIFASLFTGSMRGRGDLQLVFMYMISNANQDGVCDFTPQCIADATGKPTDLVLRCIEELETPDPMSRTRRDNGRRIARIDPERPWGWQITNYEMYREIATREAMKETERLRKQAWREGKRQAIEDKPEECPGHVPDTAGHSPYPSPSSCPSGSEVGGVGEGVPNTRPVLGYSDKSFQKWTKEDLAEAVKDANADGLLTADEAVDFVGYWTQKTARGKYLFWTEKTWDTRRRMNNALKLIYEKHRKAPQDAYDKWAPENLKDDPLLGEKNPWEMKK